MKDLVTALRVYSKKRVGSALALILIGSFLVFNLGAQSLGSQNQGAQNNGRKNPLKDIKARAEKGPRVGDRVKQLRATSNAVNAALEAFEKKGHKLKFDEAFSFTGNVEKPREIALRRAHHASQQTYRFRRRS